MPLTLDDLEFSQFSFEVRFANSYLMWDRAGRIWQEVARLFPKSTVPNAAPNKIVMREDAIDLTVEPNRVYIQLFDQEKLKEIPAIAAKFVKTTLSHLEIAEYTRIGLRIIYMKVYPTKEEAAAEVLKCGLLRIPDGKHLGVSGVVLNPEVSFRKKEGSKGFVIRIKAEAVEYKLELPYLWHKVAKSVSENRETLSYDVDSFVEGTILPSQMKFEDWIEQTLHVIRRDANVFLEG